MFDQIANLGQQNYKFARARDILLARSIDWEIAV
jgi:hypothetical protein